MPMLTLAQFIAAHNGQRVTAPGGDGGQCVDLAELWRLNLSMTRVYRNAGDFAGMTIAGMQWIPNTPTNSPLPGDVVVWAKNASMPNGHIDIAVDGITSMTFRGFDQNWPLGYAAHLQEHGYWDIAGWQRPMILHPPSPTPVPPVGPVGGTGTEGPSNWFAAILDWLARIFNGGR
jgi:CHAP domain